MKDLAQAVRVSDKMLETRNALRSVVKPETYELRTKAGRVMIEAWMDRHSGQSATEAALEVCKFCEAETNPLMVGFVVAALVDMLEGEAA